MNQLKIYLLIIITIPQFCYSQERENTIETNYFPTYNSDFSYYFLRRNMRLNELLYSVETVSHEDGVINIRTKGFIPIHNSKKWNYVIPIYFDNYNFKPSNGAEAISVSNLFGQSILGFYPSEKLSFSSIFEFRFKGVESNFLKNPGNFLAQFLNARFKISEKVSITAGGLVGLGWDNNNDDYLKVLPSFQFQYTHSEYLKVMLGLPASAVEWSLPRGFDLMAHSLIEGSEFNVSTALRKAISPKFDFTLRLLNEGFSELYTPQNQFQTSINEFEYTSQYQLKYQAEFTFRPEKNTIIQFLAGYATNRDFEFTQKNEVVEQFNAADGYYLGINLAKTILNP